MTNVRATHEDAGLVFGKQYNMKTNFRSLTKLIAGIDKPILFFNVGSMLTTGDSYGPRLGTLLQGHVTIMGTEANPIHATNLAEKIEEAKRLYPDHVVIATDAAVGKADNLGNTRLQEGMLQAGAGVNKLLPPVGDYCLSCTTCQSYGNPQANLIALMTTPRTRVQGYADKAANAIMKGLARRAARLAQEKEAVAV